MTQDRGDVRFVLALIALCHGIRAEVIYKCLEELDLKLKPKARVKAWLDLIEKHQQPQE
mgnify:CR=1 FL=1